MTPDAYLECSNKSISRCCNEVENMLRRLTDPLGKCLTQDDELGLGPNSLYYDLTGGIQVPTASYIVRLFIYLNVVSVLV